MVEGSSTQEKSADLQSRLYYMYLPENLASGSVFSTHVPTLKMRLRNKNVCVFQGGVMIVRLHYFTMDLPVLVCHSGLYLWLVCSFRVSVDAFQCICFGILPCPSYIPTLLTYLLLIRFVFDDQRCCLHYYNNKTEFTPQGWVITKMVVHLSSLGLEWWYQYVLSVASSWLLFFTEVFQA